MTVIWKMYGSCTSLFEKVVDSVLLLTSSFMLLLLALGLVVPTGTSPMFNNSALSKYSARPPFRHT